MANFIKEHLLKYGIKPSLQRMAVMNYLMQHKTHPTAEEIFNDLYPVIPTLSKTTVYNTLKLFAEHNAILCIQIDDKNARYDADTSSHAHFRCKSCGCIHDLKIEGLETIHIENYGKLTVTECHIYYKGYCKDCLEKQANENENNN